MLYQHCETHSCRLVKVMAILDAVTLSPPYIAKRAPILQNIIQITSRASTSTKISRPKPIYALNYTGSWKEFINRVNGINLVKHI
mmetsp:Transcript_6838/g.14841  ORF Transcript_6838/g.14841 Transcript_6838/m.14841 type:complete len:85 (+) Transcript_6838:167-421(+)